MPGSFGDCSKLTDVWLTHRRDAEGAESFQDFLRVLRASAVKVSRVSVAMLHCQVLAYYAGTSTSRVVWSLVSSSTVAIYVRIASLIFSSASFSVLPCDQQPGKPGHQTAYPSSVKSYSIFHFTLLLGKLVLAPLCLNCPHPAAISIPFSTRNVVGIPASVKIF